MLDVVKLGAVAGLLNEEFETKWSKPLATFFHSAIRALRFFEVPPKLVQVTDTVSAPFAFANADQIATVEMTVPGEAPVIKVASAI